MRRLLLAALLLLIPAAALGQRPDAHGARGRAARVARATARTPADTSDALGALLSSHERLMQQHAQVEKMFVALSRKVAELGKAGGHAQLDATTRDLLNMNQSFNLQYLQLQSQMQNENRQYTAVSNILKNKRATLQNSLGNIR